MSENNESASNLIRTSFSKKLLKWWDMQRNPGASYPATGRGLRHIPRLPDRRFAGCTETDAEAFAHTVKNLAGVAVVASRKTDDVDDELGGLVRPISENTTRSSMTSKLFNR